MRHLHCEKSQLNARIFSHYIHSKRERKGCFILIEILLSLILSFSLLQQSTKYISYLNKRSQTLHKQHQLQVQLQFTYQRLGNLFNGAIENDPVGKKGFCHFSVQENSLAWLTLDPAAITLGELLCVLKQENNQMVVDFFSAKGQLDFIQREILIDNIQSIECIPDYFNTEEGEVPRWIEVVIQINTPMEKKCKFVFTFGKGQRFFSSTAPTKSM